MFWSRPFIGFEFGEDFSVCKINFKGPDLREINDISIVSIVDIRRAIR